MRGKYANSAHLACPILLYFCINNFSRKKDEIQSKEMRSFHNISNRKFASEPTLWRVASFLVCIQIHILVYCHVLQCQWIIGLNATIKCLICVASLSLSHFRLFCENFFPNKPFFLLFYLVVLHQRAWG